MCSTAVFANIWLCCTFEYRGLECVCDHYDEEFCFLLLVEVKRFVVVLKSRFMCYLLHTCFHSRLHVYMHTPLICLVILSYMDKYSSRNMVDFNFSWSVKHLLKSLVEFIVLIFVGCIDQNCFIFF